MQTFTDMHGDTIEVAEKLDDGELYVNATMGSVETSFYFTPTEGKRLGAAIYQASGGSTEGPVLASGISFNEGVLRLAVIHGKTVEFRYTKADSSYIETRRFQPNSCSGEGEHFRFTGYDTDREDVRAYRLDRIRGTVAVIA